MKLPCNFMENMFFWFAVMNLLIFLLPNCFYSFFYSQNMFFVLKTCFLIYFTYYFDSRSWIYSFFYSQTVFTHFFTPKWKKQFGSKKISKFMTANQKNIDFLKFQYFTIFWTKNIEFFVFLTFFHFWHFKNDIRHVF